MYGGGFDMAAALLDKLTPFDLWETRRFLGAAVGLGGALITWRITRRLAGPIAGALATALLLACPLYYGHMFMNPKDAPFATAMALLLLGLLRAIDDYPRPSPVTIIVFGAGLGFSMGSRIMAGLVAFDVIAPFAILIASSVAASSSWRVALREFGLFCIRLIPAGLIGYVLMGLLWPWSVINPLNPFYAVAYFSHFFEKPWRELFQGSLILIPDMPRSYVPVLFWLKLPELFLALGIGGVLSALVVACQPRFDPRWRASLSLIVVAAVLPVFYAFFLRPPMYNGLRHFLFILPPLAALAGLFGAQVAAWLWQRSKAAVTLAGIVAAVGVADPIRGMAALHPYEYVSFNHMAGGVRGAEKRYMLDYWGLSFKQAAHELRTWLAAHNEQPKSGHWKVAVCGPHPPAAVELGPQFSLSWEPKGADFALMLGAFYCAELKASVIAEIRREGVMFARVYDIRGRDFTSLFAYPPVTR
jgi:hypothetical protein